MISNEVAPHGRLTRRKLLTLAVAGTGAVVVTTIAGISTPGEAASQISQKAVSYRDTPMGKSRCDNCKQWQPPAACKLVAGTIAPSGWCSIYTPKP